MGSCYSVAGHHPLPSGSQILQWNAKGVAKKKDALRNRLYEHKIDIACIQETHLTDKIRFSIRGYQCKRKDRAEGTKGGVIILVRNDIQAVEFTKDTNGNAEINSICIALKNRELLVYNFYCPANKQLSLDAIDIPDAGCFILGDFNSHSQSWGYDEMDHRGEEVENWQIDQTLQLLNDLEDQDTFYTRRWRTTSTPDLDFATDDIAKCTTCTVQDQLAGSDHRSIMLTVVIQWGLENRDLEMDIIIPRTWNTGEEEKGLICYSERN
ncbi:RNA-directed DNA polymerase from mobile element jockey [Elysia marginata]|uniref:RNA-directed DNA polymerase from mobile element jockey n=1 Tax=Elysia marginata TaxID=1093978 RepID=A0AAV4IZ98_9GAST|nr:RNA-directed DNA polymerase from mobile element jockey [Elysia marginata]